MAPATDLIREDDTVASGISYSPQLFEVFGERPKLTCQVQRTASNITLYDFQTTDCRIAFEKSY
ncbi:surface lipoprotein assembly modifier [Octadecabacter arcticus]|uniref:surface lipoprotein assembly modifier n=1 Tax=Octadecabacter arcticus TaxID=53946 RepID=UPI001181AF84